MLAEMNRMKKTIFVVLLFFLVPSNAFAGFAGIWATDCKKNDGRDFFLTGSTIAIWQAYESGPMMITGVLLTQNYARTINDIKDEPGINVINSTTIQIINKSLYFAGIKKEKSLNIRNKTLRQCVEYSVPKYETVAMRGIEENIIGEWRPVKDLRAGSKVSKNHISGRAHIDFRDKNNYAFKSENGLKGIYTISGDVIIFDKKEESKKKILLINEKELHMAQENNPALGITVYKKVEDKKVRADSRYGDINEE